MEEIFNSNRKQKNKKKDYVGWIIWLCISGILYYLGNNYLANRNFILFIGILLVLSFILVIILNKLD